MKLDATVVDDAIRTVSHCKVKSLHLMVSTPNAPDGLFERIEKEAEDTCLYKRLFLDYTYGIGKIYTADEIEKAKQ
jgi:hypothetical protein